MISEDDEEALWKNALGTDTPRKLVDTVLYLFGLHFALRAGKEHKNLRVGAKSQIAFKQDRKNGLRFLRYTEDCSKSRQGMVRKVK